jgi:hypothetical protein
VKQVTATVSLPCSPEAFWRVYLDPEYARALYLGELGYKRLDVLEATDASRRLRVVPKLNVPRPIEALLGDSFAYEDHGTLDRATNVWTWRMVQPDVLAPGARPRKNVVTTSGTLRVEADGAGRCRRTDDLTIEAHVFGLGALIESSAAREAHAAWAKEFAFLQRRLEQPEA